MKYIIKRLTKLFSSKAALNGRPENVYKDQSEGVLIELIKIIEFYDRDRNMRHWISDEIVNRYFKETVDADDDLVITDIFGRLESDIPKRFRQQKILLGLSRGDNFIRETLGKFKPGKDQYNKYKKDYKVELDSMDPDNLVPFYKRVLKYLALSFSGQLNPKNVDFWDSTVDRTKVNYNSKSETNRDLEEAKDILVTCIINIKGYETKSIKECGK